MNGDYAPEPVRALTSPSLGPAVAAPPLPGQPGYNWVLHGDSHPDLAAIMWPVAEAIRTMGEGMVELERTVRKLGDGQEKIMRLLANLGGFMTAEQLEALREVEEMTEGECIGVEDELRREIEGLKARVKELEKIGKTLEEGVASAGEQVADRLHALDGQIDQLKTIVLADVRDLRISATEHRISTNQDIAIQQSQLEEFWRHLLEAEGSQQGWGKPAAARKEHTVHEGKSVHHWVGRIVHASHQRGIEEQSLRRCLDDIEFMATRRPHRLPPMDRPFMLDGSPRIGFLQRSVKWLRECYEAVRQSEERFSVARATVPRKRHALG